MGNCLVLEEDSKVIKVMKTDGKILEYKPPLKVHEVLAEFSGHVLSDSLPEIRKLMPDFKLLGGSLYFLVPAVPSVPTPRKVQKRVRFLDEKETVGDGEKEGGTGIVRIKLVISKQELQDLLQKGGVVSLQDILSQTRSSKQIAAADFQGDDHHHSNKGWRPELESIPELDEQMIGYINI